MGHYNCSLAFCKIFEAAINPLKTEAQSLIILWENTQDIFPCKKCCSVHVAMSQDLALLHSVPTEHGEPAHLSILLRFQAIVSFLEAESKFRVFWQIAPSSLSTSGSSSLKQSHNNLVLVKTSKTIIP